MQVKSSDVTPFDFVQAMNRHWTDTLNNASSFALREVWHQMANAFNHQIHMETHSTDGRWQVLKPATGTGKSQGLSVYCSMLALERHPGVLIVVRQICQADELADTINGLAGQEVAVARHSDNKITMEDLSQIPVAIITHQAYRLALDAVSRGEETEQSAFHQFHRFRAGRRKLVVIDESLDVIEEARVDYNEVQMLRSILPAAAETEDIPEAVQALDKFISIHRLIVNNKGSEQGAKIPDEMLEGLSAEDFIPLRAYLRTIPLDRLMTRKKDRQTNAEQVKRFDEILNGIQTVVTQWRWYAKKGKEELITTARYLMNDVNCGAVVLDATADQNILYDLFGTGARVWSIPSDARSYQNVTLHVLMGHSVGKSTMIPNAPKVARELFTSLKAELDDDRKVFVCCHKDVKPNMVAYGDAFKQVSFAHWGAVDGRNDWADHDVAVIAGLPFRDNLAVPNAYMAVKGEQDASFFTSKKLKKLKLDLEVSFLVVNVVQAINRVQCRRVIDEHGNCKPTDVFILLPNNKKGVGTLEGIKQQMPGIKVVDWDYGFKEGRTSPRKSKHNDALLAYAETMPVGRVSFSEIRDGLGMTPNTVKRLQQRLKDSASQMRQALNVFGVTYKVEGKGQGRRSYLVKEAMA